MYETVPADLLTGSLADVGFGVPLAVALPPPQDRALSDVWSALGGELKPSLDVSLIAPLLPERFGEVGPPVTRQPLISLTDTGSGGRESYGGRPVDRPIGVVAEPAAEAAPDDAAPPRRRPSRARKRA
jgi:hypothetical protein